MKAFQGQSLCFCELQHILEISWLRLSEVSLSWVWACVLIIKGRRTHPSLVKGWVNQKKKIYQYVNPSPEQMRCISWFLAYVSILKGGSTHGLLIKAWVDKIEGFCWYVNIAPA